MGEYLQTIYEGVTEISPDEAMAALMIGLAVALACSGLYALGRKWASDPFPLLCGLIFAASAGSMAFGIGHARHKSKAGIATDFIGSPGPGPARTFGPGAGAGAGAGSRLHPFSRDLLQNADADANGQLTPDEVAQFIRAADATGKGWADAIDIDRARKGSGGPRGPWDFHPASARPLMDRGQR